MMVNVYSYRNYKLNYRVFNGNTWIKLNGPVYLCVEVTGMLLVFTHTLTEGVNTFIYMPVPLILMHFTIRWCKRALRNVGGRFKSALHSAGVKPDEVEQCREGDCTEVAEGATDNYSWRFTGYSECSAVCSGEGKDRAAPPALPAMPVARVQGLSPA